MSSSNWLVVLRQWPPLLEQCFPGPVAPAPQPNQPDEHKPQRRPEQPDGASPPEPPVARGDVALPPDFEVTLGQVVGLAQGRVERRVARQVIDEGLEPAPTPPPLEQQDRGGGERIGGRRIRPVAPERPVELVQIELHPSGHLPVQPQRVEAVPLPRGHGRVPLLEPERQPPPHPRAQRQMSELMAEGDGQAGGRGGGEAPGPAPPREERAPAPPPHAPPRGRGGARARAG